MITQISSGDDADSLQITEEGLSWQRSELIGDLSPEDYYTQKLVTYNIKFSTKIGKALDDFELLKLNYKTFWIELNCSNCKKYSIGCIIDYNCNDNRPFIWANVQDNQITFSEFSVKNYFNNHQYSIVVSNKMPTSPVKIQRVDFNQSEKDIINDVKMQLAFM